MSAKLQHDLVWTKDDRRAKTVFGVESQVLESFRLLNRRSRHSGSGRTIIRSETNSRNSGRSIRIEKSIFSARSRHHLQRTLTVALK